MDDRSEQLMADLRRASIRTPALRAQDAEIRARIDALIESGEISEDELHLGALLARLKVYGHDTTATAIAYAMWQLGHHPQIQHTVANEVMGLGDRPLTPGDLTALTYTTQVVREAMRLCPPVAVSGRTAEGDIAIDGYRVTAGSMVLVGIFGLHRAPEPWPDPLTFDPDRFSAENMRDRDLWHYIPFGKGPRTCIGDHFAMYEAVLALAAIIRTTEITSVSDEFPLAVPFTMVAGGPTPARVRRRST